MPSATAAREKNVYKNEITFNESFKWHEKEERQREQEEMEGKNGIHCN